METREGNFWYVSVPEVWKDIEVAFSISLCKEIMQRRRALVYEAVEKEPQPQLSLGIKCVWASGEHMFLHYLLITVTSLQLLQ